MTMRAMLMFGEGRLEMADVAVPERPPNGALVRVRASALGLFHQQMAAGMIDTGGLPRILGHEIVGEIVEADSPATPSPGSLVVADAVVGCGVCEWCVRGSESICPWMRHLGIDLDGGFAEYAVVPESNVFPLSAETPLDEAVMLSSALPAAVHGMRRSGIAAGARMVVSGIGSIGLTVCQVARAMGATTIVAADVTGDHLAAAEPWVDATGDVSGLSPTESAEALREALGAPRGADLTFEASGHPASVDTVLRTARPGGTVLLMGIVPRLRLAALRRLPVRLHQARTHRHRHIRLHPRRLPAGQRPLRGPSAGSAVPDRAHGAAGGPPRRTSRHRRRRHRRQTPRRRRGHGLSPRPGPRNSAARGGRGVAVLGTPLARWPRRAITSVAVVFVVVPSEPGPVPSAGRVGLPGVRCDGRQAAIARPQADS